MGTAGGTPEATQATEHGLAQDQPDPDNTITRIDLAADGSATWEITFRTRLATEDDQAEYERFQESFRENPSQYLEPFETRMTGVVDRAHESHTREMRATGFTTRTTIQEIPRRWGVVTFQFTWDGFAAIDGDRVIAGDVFEGGFYIGEDDVLEVAAPDGFVVADAEPTPDEVSDSILEWHGREDFADGHPRVFAGPSESTTAMQQDGEFDENGIDARTLFVFGLFTFGLLLAVLYAFRTGRLALPIDGGGDNSLAGTVPEEETDATTTSNSDPEQSQLLTDEDQVLRALREQGGRMKQSAVVEDLGWSKSKTSRVLSAMADDGTVEKLRIGRENVIDLSDDE
ncbi:helix-turn-helix transcriptional regulator [Natronorubrum sp. DTA7]|uniref:helix-turn-helix transcriptional regulator n=1 Tax=Natronorubrum sp. DTA7 TaxID=3447016 RepID=UPI003F828CCC